MMEKMNSAAPPASPNDLPRPSSSSSSPSCASMEQPSPLQNQPSASLDATRSSRSIKKADIPTTDSTQSPITLTTVLTSHKMETAAAPDLPIMDVEDEVEEKLHRSKSMAIASTNGSPTLSSPPPLLPAPAKTSACPVPPPTSTAAFPSFSSSTLLSHIPVISLSHSKPPLPLPNTPLTALHPIPNLIPGDIRRSQQTCLPMVSHGAPGLSGGLGGPSAASPGLLLAQQYMPAHPFLPR